MAESVSESKHKHSLTARIIPIGCYPYEQWDLVICITKCCLHITVDDYMYAERVMHAINHPLIKPEDL